MLVTRSSCIVRRSSPASRSMACSTLSCPAAASPYRYPLASSGRLPSRHGVGPARCGRLSGGRICRGVLAAERVSFILVGSAALWLRGEAVSVGDTDVVIEPGEANLHRVHDSLKTLAMHASALPSSQRLAMRSIVPVQTSFGKLDLLLEGGRQDWDWLRPGADFVDVTDVGVLVASAADCCALRRLYKRW